MGDLKSKAQAPHPDKPHWDCEFIIRPKRTFFQRNPHFAVSLISPTIWMSAVILAPEETIKWSFYVYSFHILFMLTVAAIGAHCAPVFVIGKRGIEIRSRLVFSRKRLAWDQVTWRQESEHVLWIVWEDQWLRLDLRHYPYASLLQNTLQSRANEAPLPAGPITILQANSREQNVRVDFRWTSGHFLNEGDIIDTSRPLSAQGVEGGRLILTQNGSTIEIHPLDPRRRAIESAPQVLIAMKKMSAPALIKAPASEIPAILRARKNARVHR